MTTVKIGGKEYPVRFSIGVLAAMNDKYGENGQQKIFEAVEKGDVGPLIWLTKKMIETGVKYRALMGETVETDTPDEEALGVLIGPAEMPEVMQAITAAMTEGNKTTVESAAKDKKK